MKIRLLDMVSNRPVAKISTAARRQGVLVALHGHGDRSPSALSWGRRIAPPGWQVITPQARQGRDGVPSWFESGPRGVDSDSLGESIRKVEDLVAEHGANGQRVVLAGFSQGAALALAMAMRGTGAQCVISMCGFFPEWDPMGDSGSAPQSGSRPSVLIIGAQDDQQVPAFMSDDAAGMFRGAGFDIESLTMAGVHHVDADMAAVASEFATRGLPREPLFSLGLPVERVEAEDQFLSADAIAELAHAYENLGFHAAYVTDHPAPDDRWLAGGGHHALEPAAALSVAAAASSTLKLHTNVYVLPYRNPFLAAKALASVDVMAQGRLIAGVAAGYVRPEFAALGVDFENRGKLFEASLRVLPQIWSGSSVSEGGSTWQARSATSLPATHGGPPMWVGGNSPAALRRAVTLAQGWSPMPTPAGSGKGLRTTEITDIAALAKRLERARELCEIHERRAPLTICFVPFSLGRYMAAPSEALPALVEEVAELVELGVQWIPLMVPGESRDQVIDAAAELASALGLSAR